MKLFTRFLLVAALVTGIARVQAQAPKFVLFEHFTQASCGPCAAQNPGFQSTVINPNPGVVRHIAYHTSWPGVDPMYTHNTTQSTDRVNYYGVTGVPSVTLNGNKKTGLPGSFSQADVDGQFAESSPIKVLVSEVDNGSTRDVTITIQTLSTVPSGNYVLRTVVVEDPINYSSPPGSNGETHFPNVFRLMLPSSAGESITLPSAGNSAVFVHTYTENTAWDLSKIKVIAFVQNENTKEVLNTGSTVDPVINYSLIPPAVDVAGGSNGTQSSFTLTSGNTGSSTEEFVYTLTSNAPSDWAADFSIGTTTYSSTATLNVNAGATNTVTVSVTPGTSPAVAEFTLSVKSTAYPSSPVLSKTFYVMANVTDLVINNSGGIGDGSGGDASTYEGFYTNGLQFAGNSGYAATRDPIAARFIENGEFGGVNNIYYNIAWTFPAFPGEIVNHLVTFLEGGGNLFIAGQDIGWDTWDVVNGGNGTAATQSFYTNYLGAGYSGDGNSANTMLTTVTADLVWGNMPNAGIVAAYGSYYYPDELTVGTNGHAIYKYNSGNKIGGVRATNGTWKTVYIGIGMEMLTGDDANDIVKLAHDWFYGIVSTEELDQAMAGPGQNYPNPASDFTTIPVSNLNEDASLRITDMTGKLVLTETIAKGSSEIRIDTRNLGSGLYIYTITGESGTTPARSMQVIH